MNMLWLIYALLGMLFFSLMILLFKRLTILNLKPAALLFLVAIFLVFFYMSHILITKTPVKINQHILVIIIAAAFFSYIANLFYTKSIEIAPNPGYSAAIIGLQAAVIALASVLFFGSGFSLTKGLGVLLAVAAVIFLSF